jgi:adenine deaminase
MSRRELMRRALAGVVSLASSPIRVGGAQSRAGGEPARVEGDLVLVNGKFVDGRGIVASSLTIKNGRILGVGRTLPLGPDAQTIDLGGRTVIHGMVDSYVH